MSINKFYTALWVLYFSLCLAFYFDLNHINRYFDYSDEFLTLGLVVFTLFEYKKWWNKEARSELYFYVLVMLLYLLYAYIAKNNIFEAALLDFQQQVRPHLILYCTWLLAPRFTQKQKKWMLWVMAGAYAFFLFRLFSGGITTVLDQENSPVIGQMALMSGMAYYILNKKTSKNLWITLGIVTTGLITGKTKFFGEYVVFIAIFFFLKGKIRRVTSLKRILQLAILVVAVLYFTWTKFNVYYVEGFDVEKTEQMMARPATYRVARFILFRDYVPFGSGLGTFATNAVAVHYSPLYYKYGLNKVWGLEHAHSGFIADAFYPTLAEFGIVGVLLFILFWVRRWRNVKMIMDDRYYKVALMCMMCLALESVADTSYLSGKGMGYFMLLGICMGTVKYQPKEFEQHESDDGRLRKGERGRSGDSHPDPGVAARVERV